MGESAQSQPTVGILLAGGTGSRLGPVTHAVNKHLLPVFDKPLLYYPLSTLMLAGVRRVVVVCRSKDAPSISAVLGDGSRFGIDVSYAYQNEPLGVVDGFNLTRDAVDGKPSWLVLGDNIFLGSGLGTSLQDASPSNHCQVFAYEVEDVSPYGAVTLSPEGEAMSLVEKPPTRKRGLAVPGLYRFPPDAHSLASQVRPGARGELEVVDLLAIYAEHQRLRVHRLPRGSVWIDAGTPPALERASHLVSLLSELQGRVLACPEEISYRSGWTTYEDLERAAESFVGSQYGHYLQSIVNEGNTFDGGGS